MKTRNQTITFRVTDDEYNMIREKAKRADLTVTQFIVKCCMEKRVAGSDEKNSNSNQS